MHVASFNLFNLPERFQAKISPEPMSGCWLWDGAQSGRDDKPGAKYGQIMLSVDGKQIHQYAHRAVYELLAGEIPQGLQLDHLCKTRPCVNPAHLEPVTGPENVKRGERAMATHCRRGHEYTFENTKHCISGAGRKYRQCIQCATDKSSQAWVQIKSNAKPLEKLCLHCGSEFLIVLGSGRHKDAVYCSDKCRWAHRKHSKLREAA